MELSTDTLIDPMISRKDLAEITVVQSRHDREFVLNSAVKCVLTLQQVLDTYMIMLGHKNEHVLAIFNELMTRGKVRVEFRDYFERLQLEDPNLRLEEEEVTKLFSEYLPESPARRATSAAAGATQKIMVQLPRPVDLRRSNNRH